MKQIFFILVFISVFIFNCSEKKESTTLSKLEMKMNTIAEDYIKLALEIGKYNHDFVDAYFGPEKLKPSVDNSEFTQETFEQLNFKVNKLLDDLESLSEFPANEIERQRFTYLYKQLLACKTIIYMLNGMTLTFDEELNALYDIEIGYKDESYFKDILEKLNTLLPGKGNIYNRFISFRENFRIPSEKLHDIFSIAINECRERTKKFIQIPHDEKFELNFVKDKPWSAYNWFKGNAFSVIEINTDLPIYVDRIIDLASHEGYPGHHLHHSMMENNLYKKRNWIEFSINLLFSPQSLISEGIANYGSELLFPNDERIKFEKEIIFKAAGLDTSQADLYYEVMNLVNKLNYSINTASKNYIDGKWNEEKTIDWLKKYNLRTDESARKFLSFIKRYRTYIVNYSAGYDLIKFYIDTKDSQSGKWKTFLEIITTPVISSNIEKLVYEN
jgi:hypothetical protein